MHASVAACGICNEECIHERRDDLLLRSGIGLVLRDVCHRAIYRPSVPCYRLRTDRNRLYWPCTEASHSGLVHRLGKAACRKASSVRIAPPPQRPARTNAFEWFVVARGGRDSKANAGNPIQQNGSREQDRAERGATATSERLGASLTL